ncbi:MAG TPA: hypothetical protein VLT91_01660 [Rhizomicrobium sp.]|nr:hypothetical protein [Rhizomicrobium sp.]
MADNAGSGGNTFLAFIVGALLVVVVVFGFFYVTGGHMGGTGGTPTAKLDVNVKH